MAKNVGLKLPKSADAFVRAGGATSGATVPPAKPKAETVRVTVDFPIPDHRALKIAATQEGEDMQTVIRKLVSDWLAQR